MHDPSSVLDRAEAAHLQVLFGGGGPVVGGVVDHDDEEARALLGHLAVDRREAVLVTDRRPDRRETGDRDQRHLVTRRSIHRDLIGRRDPTELPAERHVLAERHQLHLHVPVDDPARPVERERHGALGAIGIVGDGAGDRGCPDGRDRLAHRGHHQRIRRDPRIERSLPPHDEVGRIVREREMAVDVEPGDRDVLVRADEILDRGDVDLDRRDVEGSAVGSRDRDRHGHDRQEDGPGGQDQRRRTATTPPPFPREQEQAGDHHHQEGQRPDPADRREGQRGGVDLGHAQLPPAEPAERDHPSDPFDDGPQARQPERAEQSVLAPPDGRCEGPERRREPRRHDHERRPPELAEQEDPIQECPEVGEPEREAAQRGPTRTRAPHQPQERDRRHEHDGPQPDGRQGDRQQRAGDRCDQEGDREPEPARAQAQSRQSIFALSFSWLRCLTR